MEDGSIVVVLAETIFMLMLLESFWTNNIKTQLLGTLERDTSGGDMFLPKI